jgi:hypothetical protein
MSDLAQSRFVGMTVNERLMVADLLARFDAAAVARDRAAMLALLAQVELNASQAAQTADAILAAPKRYGY